MQAGCEIPVPSQDQSVEAGVTLTLTARLESGRIIFRGFCRIKEPDSTDNNNDISTVAFYAREAFFLGYRQFSRIEASEG